MNKATNIVQNLRKLAQFDAELPKLSEDSQKYQEIQNNIESLRAPLPTAILGHYDGRKAHGKLGIAPVRRGVCGACHLLIPSGRLADLRRKPEELNVCDNCGVFVYWTEDELAPSSASALNGTTVGMTRKAKHTHAKRA